MFDSETVIPAIEDEDVGTVIITIKGYRISWPVEVIVPWIVIE